MNPLASHLIGNTGELLWVAVKALLLFLIAVIAFRLAPRRTIAEMAPFDFVAAVAAGAIVGRVPNASDTAFLAGAVTLVTILIAHSIIARMRLYPRAEHLVVHAPRILVVDGHIQEPETGRCGLTHDELVAMLRVKNVTSLSDVRYAIFERSGVLSVVKKPHDLEDAMMHDLTPV
jgi:uncharacterized membrane protein YcaP (DUF421 family)